MRALAALLAAAAGFLLAHGASAQPQRQQGRVPACDLTGAPEACSSCAGLAAALPSIPADRLSTGPTTDSVLWTPLYVAQRLHCLDVGMTLLRRGADPNVGGRGGALVVEVARSASPDAPGASRAARRSRAMDWLHRLGRFALDVDGRLPDGSSNRVAWIAAEVADPDARDIWSYALGISAAQPVLADGAQPGSPDLPSADTGMTRPSETAVARGVELFDIIYKQTGMSGLIARLQDCWAERRPPSLTRAQLRWSYEACGSLDLASSAIHAAFLKEMPKAEPLPYFQSYTQDERLRVYRQFAGDGLIPAVHRRALSRSVGTWLEITAFAERPRAAPPGLPGAPSGTPGGPTSPATLIEPSAQLTYPDGARRSGEAGEVGLVLRVTEDGRVIVVDVDKSSGFGNLDDAARLTAFRWRFRPAMRDGLAVSAYPRAVANFSIAANGSGRASVRLTAP
ncbi:MAG: hypothetical protein DI532_23020 [Azospirillum brasilense]|nr:MAG: hypothetical protein DI532_23020 [Azospirillum brasilense]